METIASETDGCENNYYASWWESDSHDHGKSISGEDDNMIYGFK